MFKHVRVMLLSDTLAALKQPSHNQLCFQCRDEYLAMGILHITNAVSFLNNDCKLVGCVYDVQHPMPSLRKSLLCFWWCL